MNRKDRDTGFTTLDLRLEMRENSEGEPMQKRKLGKSTVRPNPNSFIL